MPKTTFSDKCNVLGTLWAFYRGTDNEVWQEFFSWGDVGLPLSYMIHINVAKPTPEGKVYIEECWNVFCDMIDIDRDGHYPNLMKAFDASAHPPLVE